MSDDHELEMLKAKRLAEMQKNITSQAKPQPAAEQKKTIPFRDTLISKLGYRGMEVLQNAERQFPNETKMIVDKLGELIQTGEINEELDGGKLLALFRSVGINVRMETKISVEQDGKFVSLSDKLTTKDDSND
jgi:DNA-binding TFAR19-related protein (PDSD5 family)